MDIIHINGIPIDLDRMSPEMLRAAAIHGIRIRLRDATVGRLNPQSQFERVANYLQSGATEWKMPK